MAPTESPPEIPEFMPLGVGRPPSWAWAAIPGLSPWATRPRLWASIPAVGGRLCPLFWRLPLGAGSDGPVGPKSLRAGWPWWKYGFHPPYLIPHPWQVDLQLSLTSSKEGLSKSRPILCSETLSPWVPHPSTLPPSVWGRGARSWLSARILWGYFDCGAQCNLASKLD